MKLSLRIRGTLTLAILLRNNVYQGDGAKIEFATAKTAKNEFATVRELAVDQEQEEIEEEFGEALAELPALQDKFATIQNTAKKALAAATTAKNQYEAATKSDKVAAAKKLQEQEQAAKKIDKQYEEIDKALAELQEREQAAKKKYEALQDQIDELDKEVAESDNPLAEEEQG